MTGTPSVLGSVFRAREHAAPGGLHLVVHVEGLDSTPVAWCLDLEAGGLTYRYPYTLLRAGWYEAL